jgi:hypothetical protein
MWENLHGWFVDIKERKALLRSFNYSARNAYTFGHVPVLLKASVSLGRRENKTNYSWLRSGIRIKTSIPGYLMGKQESTIIAMIILSDQVLVRQLVALGFDTLEVGSDSGVGYYSWPLIRFAIGP